MNGIEERLREELREFAQQAGPGSIRPLRPPLPRRRIGKARWLAPIAAATAVAAAVAGATLAGRAVPLHPAGPGHGYPRIPAYPGMPAYYAAVTQVTGEHGTSTNETAGVYATVTGRLLAKVAVPENGSIAGNVWVSAAASDREFVISGADSSLYLLRLAADGHSEGLHQLAVTDARPQYMFPALSPDGSRVAYMARVCENGGCEYGVGVMPVGQPDAARFWVWPGLAPGNLSWAPDGTQVMFNLAQGQLIAQDTQYRLLTVTGPGGNLLTDSREVSLPVAMRAQLALLTPGGRDVVGATVQVHQARNPLRPSEVTAKFLEVSPGTGRQQVLYVTKAPGRGTWQETGVLALASTGVQPLVVCNQGLGLIERGKFVARPGLPAPAPLAVTGRAAAW